MFGIERVGIVVAMPSEFSLIAEWLRNAKPLRAPGTPCFIGKLGKVECILMLSGIGKVNAAIRTNQMIDSYSPLVVMNVGISGGLYADSVPGDLIMSDALVYHDVWCGEGNQIGQIQGLPPRFHSNVALAHAFHQVKPELRQGLFCTGEYFIPTEEELTRIHTNFPEAIAVDMESAAAAQVCLLYGKPYLSVRIVSDTPYQKVDHKDQYRDFWDNRADESFSQLGKIVRAVFETLG